MKKLPDDILKKNIKANCVYKIEFGDDSDSYYVICTISERLGRWQSLILDDSKKSLNIGENGTFATEWFTHYIGRKDECLEYFI